MRVLIVGATGMVGQGALRECLSAPDVREVPDYIFGTRSATSIWAAQVRGLPTQACPGEAAIGKRLLMDSTAPRLYATQTGTGYASAACDG